MKRLTHKHIQEVCRDLELGEEIILHFIEEEWIVPFDEEHMILDEEDMARIHLIHELQEDLGVNDEAVPIILNLLDQLNLLRSHIKKLGQE